MLSQLKKTVILALLFCGNSAFIPASLSQTPTTANAANSIPKSKTLNGGVKKTTVAKHTQTKTWGERHPKMKAAAVGGGIGAAAGGATGLLTGRGVVRGAAIGAGTGAGVGVMRKTNVMKRHPIVSDTATGAAVGLGLGLASGRRHTTGKAALIGGAAGLGFGLWKNRKNL